MIAIGGMQDAENSSSTVESDQSDLLTEGLECYLVGGSVRDRKLGLGDFDQDWVVIGASEDEMLRRGFKRVGLSFPVFLHPRTKEEYALARTEYKAGRGYKGFAVDVSRTVTLEQDLKRRDLTINAMAMAPDGRLIDPFCGERDLNRKVLRHVSEHFAEDPLRVLRVARFAARFNSKGFRLAEETRQLMSAIAAGGELDDLVPERVWREVQTVLSGDDPWIFFQTLQNCDALEKLFPDLLVLFQNHNAVDGAKSSQLTQRAETALRNVATESNNAEVRFSVLMFLVGEHELSAVEKFCDHWKVPGKYSKLAIQASKFGKQAFAMSEMSPEKVVDFVRALDGIRNPKRLDNCVAVWEAVSLPDSSNVSLLPSYRDAMTSVDAKVLVPYLKGNALINRIREIQVENVAHLMQEYVKAGIR